MPGVITPSKLYDAIQDADQNARPFRDFYTEAERELVGRFYKDDDGQRRPLNLIARNLFTLQAHLAHRNPGHQVTTKIMPLRGEAQIRAQVLDDISEDLDRVKISRIQLLRAMLGPMAVTKIGIRAGADMVKINGRLYNPGEPYILPIDISDHLADPWARCRDEMGWEGHRYRVPRLMAAECGLYDPDVIMRLPAVSDGRDRRRGVDNEKIGRSALTPGDEMTELIELVDIVFYDDGGSTIATLPGEDNGADDFLAINEFQGPMRGPYEWLELYPLPNQLYGLPIVALMREPSDVLNKILNKMCEQIIRTKRILAAERGNRDDLETAAQVEDGETAEFDDITKVANFDIGGVQQDGSPMAQFMLQLSNMQHINYEVAGGSEGGTDKATIYQGIQANVNVSIEDIQTTQEAHESRVSSQLHWYIDTDPLIQHNTTMRIPGGEYLDVIFDAATKRGEFQQFTTKIKYGSMIHQDPQVKAANLLKVMEVGMGSLQLTMATGGAWKTDAALRLISRHLGYDELDELVDDPVLQQQMMLQIQAAGMPAQGQVSGPSGVNPQALYGSKPQPKGGAGRPQSNGAPRQPAGIA